LHLGLSSLGFQMNSHELVQLLIVQTEPVPAGHAANAVVMDRDLLFWLNLTIRDHICSFS
jgi:hypothetical protein